MELKSLIYILAKRILYYLVTMFVAFSLLFWILRLIPGDPVTTYVAQMTSQTWIQQDYLLELVQRYKQMFGLDKDLFTQYVLWLENGVLKFNFGPSFLSFPTPAEVIIWRALPWSIGLLMISTLISWVVGLILGTIAAKRTGSKIDSILLIYSLIMSQMPFFLLGIVLLIVLGFGLALFPTSGAYSPIITPSLSLAFISDVIYHAILPSLSLVIISMCQWLLTSRGSDNINSGRRLPTPCRS